MRGEPGDSQTLLQRFSAQERRRKRLRHQYNKTAKGHQTTKITYKTNATNANMKRNNTKVLWLWFV